MSIINPGPAAAAAPRGSDRELPPWGRTEIGALLELRDALDAVVDTRRTYNRRRRP
ncbi:hypothetical protein [Couchioplanes caeruleus]|uniref:Uncharacterized protein n=1 Tax=Couchioplanes caeruleus TaxID=56438 RepID=A0A3N1GTK7_9ACTN|nr:hypothetical protein [Couchioplanes caeruleus]ROP33579.1 hypothetical protein EDD30_6580 [Couchioplanes caeruleus]